MLSMAGGERQRDDNLIAAFRRQCAVAPEVLEGTPGKVVSACSKALPKNGLRDFLRRNPEVFQVHSLMPLRYSLLPVVAALAAISVPPREICAPGRARVPPK